MKLNAREDIDAPSDFVFRTLANFDHWERTAMRRGADLARTDTLSEPGPGMAWRAGFAWRGKPRSLTLRLTELDPGHALGFAGLSPSIEGTLRLDVVEMGTHRTRLAAMLEIRPRTLAARLFLQSLRLTRGRVTRRYQAAIGQLAAAVKDRFVRGVGV